MITRSLVGTGSEDAANCSAIASEAKSFAATAADDISASVRIKLSRMPVRMGPRPVDFQRIFHDHRPDATGPYRWRRPRWLRSRLAVGKPWRSRGDPRDAPPADDRGPQDGEPRRTGLLELVPLRRSRNQCGRVAARGDAPAWLAHHAGG